MLLNTGIQFSIIMYAILAGILTGAMFDLYRIIRGSNVNKVIIAILDISCNDCFCISSLHQLCLFRSICLYIYDSFFSLVHKVYKWYMCKVWVKACKYISKGI